MANKPTILALADYYRPALLGGGASQTLANIVNTLGDEFNFRILTRNHDLGSRDPFLEVPTGVWCRHGAAEVYYAPEEELVPRKIWRHIRLCRHDLLLLNSSLSPRFSIYPLLGRLIGQIPPTAVLLCPRGEMVVSALAKKAIKKKAFLTLARLSGLYRGVDMVASTKLERNAIAQVFPHAKIHEASNPTNLIYPDDKHRNQKAPGRLKILFLSRIVPIKNLLFILEILQGLPSTTGRIELDIYGPTEDKSYWHACKKEIARLPGHIRAEYRGIASPDEVTQVMAGYDMMFLPTRGENFGHVILESFAAGTPVLISDQTCWRNLEEKRVGWDIPLQDRSTFVSTLVSCMAMDETQWASLREAACRYSKEVIAANDATNAWRKLLQESCLS